MMHQVRIEFLRVQTFLFAVPRLRDMIGANVLLGEVIRVDLPGLARDNGSSRLPVDKIDLPSSDSNDPLHQVNDKEDLDDPRVQYEHGILTRDGGHFIAVFPDEDKAGQFQQQAEALLIDKLPGLRFEIHPEPFGTRQDSFRRAQSQSLMDLPTLQVCEESGNGPASCQERYKDEPRPRHFSKSVATRKNRGKKFQNRQKTRDIVGLLRDQFPPSDRNIEEPEDLEKLCGKDYLAVIHADGNGIGKRFNEWQRNQPKQPLTEIEALQKEAQGEKFYYSLRVIVRRSVLEALNATFGDYSGGYRPYQVLMLGGDDLLLICQARYALKFVVNYAKALQDKPLQDCKPLTIGAGIVIAAHNLPFHHLYHLAETLAGSAKRLYRGLTEPTSVVDWMVNTTAWADDPVDLRRRDELVYYQVNGQPETLALSGRPYRILGTAGTEYDLQSLEGLLKASQQLAKKDNLEQRKVARSQLRQLVYELPHGRRWAELRFAELPKPTREILVKKLCIEHPWQPAGERCWTTPLADLVELYEIQHLGQRAHWRKSS